MQQRWRISPDGRERTLSLPSGAAPEAITDTLFVQDELSAALLDVFDEDAPGALERRAGQLGGSLWRAQAPPRAA